jgi:hypothetical protein
VCVIPPGSLRQVKLLNFHFGSSLAMSSYIQISRFPVSTISSQSKRSIQRLIHESFSEFMFLLKGWDISGMQPRSQGAVRAGRSHPTSLIKAYTLRTAVQLLKSIGLCNHPYMLLSDRVYLFKILAVLHGHSRKAAVWKGDKHFHFQNVRLSHITQVLQSFH